MDSLSQDGLVIRLQEWGDLQRQSLNLLNDADVRYVELHDILRKAGYRAFDVRQRNVDAVLGRRRK